MLVFDPSTYFPIPQLTAGGYISLIKAMLMCAPKNPPPHIAAAIAVLKKAAADAHSQLVVRIDEDLSTAVERAFDILVDWVWSELRTRLEFAAIYAHEGAAKFTAEDRETLDIDERLEEGRVAANMLERMFPDGTDFLRIPYPEQATQMAARLDWIDSKDLEPALEEIVGPKVVTLLKVCQIRYEEMVSERSSRDGKSAADLREVRAFLRRQIAAYCGVLGGLPFQDAKWTKPIQNALRPILVTRARARRNALGLPVGSDALTEGEDKLALEIEADEAESDDEADEAEVDDDDEADESDDDEVEGE